MTCRLRIAGIFVAVAELQLLNTNNLYANGPHGWRFIRFTSISMGHKENHNSRHNHATIF